MLPQCPDETMFIKITKFSIIETWIVRQFQNEYNPLHYHGGHISGVGYLKVPEDYGKTIQDSKNQNYNERIDRNSNEKNWTCML